MHGPRSRFQAGHLELQATSVLLKSNLSVYQAGQPVWHIRNFPEACWRGGRRDLRCAAGIATCLFAWLARGVLPLPAALLYALTSSLTVYRHSRCLQDAPCLHLSYHDG